MCMRRVLTGNADVSSDVGLNHRYFSEEKIAIASIKQILRLSSPEKYADVKADC